MGSGNCVVWIFIIALLIRVVVLLNVIENKDVIFQPDSRMYISLAKGILEHGKFCYVETPEAPHAERLPGYPSFVAGLLWIFSGNLLAIILAQIVFDSLSCVLIFYLGEEVWKGSGMLSGILGATNMGLITYSHFILTDSLFLFVFLSTILLMFRVLKEPDWKNCFLLGIGYGIAALIRPVILYLPALMATFILFFLVLKRGEPLLRTAVKTILICGVFLLMLSPWLMRNYYHYERIKYTVQSYDLLQYIVPFVWQYSRGIPFIEGMKITKDLYRKEAKKAGLDAGLMNPVEASDFQLKMAMNILIKEPKSAIMKAWLYGIIKNLFSPSIIDFSYLLNIDRPHFFYTKGTTLIERARNYIGSMVGIFKWAVIIGICSLIIARIVQFAGILKLIKRTSWEGFALLLIIVYFFIVTGPVGYAKYRLPYEPILAVFLSIGIKAIYTEIFKKSHFQKLGSEKEFS